MDIHYSRYGNNEDSDDEYMYDWFQEDREEIELENDDDKHAGDGSVYRGKYEDIDYNCEKLKKMEAYDKKYSDKRIRLSKYSDDGERIEHVRDGLWTGWNWNHIYNVPRYIQLQTKGEPYAFDAEYEQYKFNLQYHFIEFISDGVVVDCVNMEEGIVEH
jgi:hypothetical protein